MSIVRAFAIFSNFMKTIDRRAKRTTTWSTSWIFSAHRVYLTIKFQSHSLVTGRICDLWQHLDESQRNSITTGVMWLCQLFCWQADKPNACVLEPIEPSPGQPIKQDIGIVQSGSRILDNTKGRQTKVMEDEKRDDGWWKTLVPPSWEICRGKHQDF